MGQCAGRGAGLREGGESTEAQWETVLYRHPWAGEGTMHSPQEGRDE